MSSPQVTVCIPVYNRSQAFRPTLDSVFSQTMEDWELVIVDDGSSDDTAEVVGSYRDARIRYLRQANQGQAAARNHGLQEARGEFIAFLDHDDRWSPPKLERQTARLSSDPECGLVYAALRFVDEAGVERGRPKLPQPEGWVFERLLAEHNFIFTMSNPLMRTAAVRAVGGFDASTGLSDDWDLFLRLSRVVQFAAIPEELVDYNLGNDASQTRDVKRVFDSECRLLARYLKRSEGVGKTIRQQAMLSLKRRFAPGFRERAWFALRGGNRRKALESYLLAVRLQPTYLLDPVLVKDLTQLLRPGTSRV